MYISLYRRYRPQKFSEMVGQSAAVSVLREALKEGHLGHAYLFSGPRGCGKTSAARLVAKGLNCQNLGSDGEPCGECEACNAIAQGEHLDVIEIDGASNRGINEIRDLKSHVNLKPLIAPYKVYIIDEVHMLTEAAFNALLKTLEEPPANVVFLLATTEPHKVPVTIRSRCQHIPFHRISMADMVNRVSYVCTTENIQADMEAVWEISRQADGALRDALSLTEQAVSLGKGNLTLESVKALTGGSNRTELEKWVINLRLDPNESNSALHAMLGRGISVERLTESLFAVFRDMWIFSLWGEKGMEALEISEEEGKFLREETPHWNAEKLRSACIFCNSLLPRARYGMRMEVFSGLIMLELVNIIEGKNDTLSSVLEVVKPQERLRSAETEQPRPDHMVRQAVPTTNVHKPLTDRVADIPPLQATEAASFEELPDKNYAKLLSKLGNRGIAIGAALLNNGILIEDSEWKLDSDVHSPSHTYLMVPQNRKLLSKALEDLCGVKDRAGKENSAVIPENLPVENRVGEDNSNIREKAPKGSLIADTDRIIKLLGAEVLYVKDANGDNETDDFGSAD
ncbi:MAG: DNA polymerase III subunit gamma/tau [Synergistaceae bacterium]|nr:DNA polymerase III subunit gamma/tau [Synergistaceae bacterium]